MNTICTVCGRPLVLKPGGVKKDGSTYKPFLGCEIWDNEHKKARDAYKAAKSGYKPLPESNFQPTPQPPTAPTAKNSSNNAELIITERLDAINVRLDKLIEFVVKKLG